MCIAVAACCMMGPKLNGILEVAEEPDPEPSPKAACLLGNGGGISGDGERSRGGGDECERAIRMIMASMRSNRFTCEGDSVRLSES